MMNGVESGQTLEMLMVTMMEVVPPVLSAPPPPMGFLRPAGHWHRPPPPGSEVM